MIHSCCGIWHYALPTKGPWPISDPLLPTTDHKILSCYAEGIDETMKRTQTQTQTHKHGTIEIDYGEKNIRDNKKLRMHHLWMPVNRSKAVSLLSAFT
jgi:hypothetical protein